jgi:hypothetical protein
MLYVRCIAMTRRLLPFALLGVMSVLALGAALLALATGPSLNQIDLQMAVARTAAAPSFDFTITNNVGIKIGRNVSQRLHIEGTWQAPDRVRTQASGGATYRSTVTIIVGSKQYVSSPKGTTELRIPSSLADPLSISDGPLYGLPPLGRSTRQQKYLDTEITTRSLCRK